MSKRKSMQENLWILFLYRKGTVKHTGYKRINDAQQLLYKYPGKHCLILWYTWDKVSYVPNCQLKCHLATTCICQYNSIPFKFWTTLHKHLFIYCSTGYSFFSVFNIFVPRNSCQKESLNSLLEIYHKGAYKQIMRQRFQ